VETLGIPAARAAAIRALARAVAEGELRLDGTEDADAARAALRALPGIGAWTADCVALRALGEPDAFPSGDLGLRRQLDAGAGPLTPERLAERAEAWRPWRAYAALHLWTDVLEPVREAPEPARARAGASSAPSSASRARLRSVPQA
jgi:AraC family transcriptional regulator of adaptative response / DNA-3-methyladenine glycosylase II